eukprot:881091-Pelagomonas_calceolata.AAC.4
MRKQASHFGLETRISRARERLGHGVMQEMVPALVTMTQGPGIFQWVTLSFVKGTKFSAASVHIATSRQTRNMEPHGLPFPQGIEAGLQELHAQTLNWCTQASMRLWY